MRPLCNLECSLPLIQIKPKSDRFMNNVKLNIINLSSSELPRISLDDLSPISFTISLTLLVTFWTLRVLQGCFSIQAYKQETVRVVEISAFQ